MRDDERCFRNTSQGYVGAVKIDGRGNRDSVPVEPGGTVWLTPEEIELTARAPRDAKNNPFIDQPYEVLDSNTGESIEAGSRPLLVPDDEERFVPAAMAGSRDENEETATTTAGSTRARRPRKAPKATPA